MSALIGSGSELSGKSVAMGQKQQSASQQYTIGSATADVDGLALGDLLAAGLAFVPAEVSGLKEHLEAVEHNSDRLLGAIFHELQKEFEVSDLGAFPGFSATPLRGSRVALVPEPEQPPVQFIRPWPNSAGEFLLVTGASAHFLLVLPTVGSCIGHDWAACAGSGLQIGNAPILLPSVDPRSFYISGTSHHCAHRTIHDRRSGKCYVAAFESFLCCKDCIFQRTCWPAEPAPALPCGEESKLAGLPAAVNQPVVFLSDSALR